MVENIYNIEHHFKTAKLFEKRLTDNISNLKVQEVQEKIILKVR